MMSYFGEMSDQSRNVAFNRAKPAPVYIPSRFEYQTSDSGNNAAVRSMDQSSTPSSPSDSSQSYYRPSASTTAPSSPSAFDVYSPPSIGYIDTSLLSRTKIQDSPQFMSIEPNEIFSPSSFRLSGSMKHYTYTPPSSHRSLSASQPSSATSTPFSSRSRYLVSIPTSGSSSESSQSSRRFDNVDEFVSPDITPPHLFNSPILCPVTNHPFNTSMMDLPGSPVRPSSMSLTNSIASPMVETEPLSSMSLYEPTQSRSGYSPYLSPQSRTRSLRSTVLESLRDRTISARLGGNFDISSVDHSNYVSAPAETEPARRYPSSRGLKRERDSDDDDDMSESDDEYMPDENTETSASEHLLEQELTTPPAITKSSSARSRTRARESSTLVRSRTVPVEVPSSKPAAAPAVEASSGSLPKCEHCKTVAVNPRYGTGRFCSSRCARTFSIKMRYEKQQRARSSQQDED